MRLVLISDSPSNKPILVNITISFISSMKEWLFLLIFHLCIYSSVQLFDIFSSAVHHQFLYEIWCWLVIESSDVHISIRLYNFETTRLNKGFSKNKKVHSKLALPSKGHVRRLHKNCQPSFHLKLYSTEKIKVKQ